MSGAMASTASGPPGMPAAAPTLATRTAAFFVRYSASCSRDFSGLATRNATTSAWIDSWSISLNSFSSSA
jgi:hypothetical protein